MRNFLNIAFGVLVGILIIAGLFLIIGSFSGRGGDDEQIMRFVSGIFCFLSCVFILGFSYIVDAAMIYIEKNKKKAEE